MNRTLSLSVLCGLVCAILGATLLVGARSQAAGPNLVSNGAFSQGATGWTPAFQAGLTPTPGGSLLVENNVVGPNGSNDGAVQCVSAIDHRFEHTYGFDAQILPAQSRHGELTMWLFSFAGTNCDGNFLNVVEAAPITSIGAWENRSGTFTPPDGAHSFKVQLLARKDAAGPGEDAAGTFAGDFDNAFIEEGAQVKNLPDPYETPTPPAQPNATLEICKYIADNGDGNVDGGTFTFQVGLGTIAQPPFLQAFPVASSEASPGCQTIDLSAYGVPSQGGELLYVVENPLAGWTNQAGYPTFSANNGPLHVGTYAGLANLGASRIDFTNKREAAVGGDPNPPTPTPAPPTPPADEPNPDPTGTPTSPPPPPTGTPTPPSPTGTPTPPPPPPTGTPTPPANEPESGPTGTPTPPPPTGTPTPPPPTSTPTPPTNQPEGGPAGTPTPPAGNPQDPPGDEPGNTGESIPGAQSVAQEGPSAPLPPDTGSGARASGGDSSEALLGALLIILGAAVTAGSVGFQRTGSRAR